MRKPSSLVVLMVFCLAGLQAMAASPGVRDDAGFFSAGAIEKADAIISQIRQRHQKGLVVETYAAIPENLKANYDPNSREKFFANWASQRFRELGVEGVLVLITKDPGHLEVSVGAATRARAFTIQDRNEMRNCLLQAFRAKKYDEGLLAAVNYAQSAFDRNMAGSRSGSAAPAPTPQRSSSGSSFFSGVWGWIVIGLIVLVVISIIRAIAANRSYGPGYGYDPNGPPPPPGYGYGGGGYGYGGGGGGFMRGLFGGLLGAAAGSWLYDKLSGRNDVHAQGGGYDSSGGNFDSTPMSDASGPVDSSGGDFDTTDNSSSSFDVESSDSGGSFDSGGDSGGGGDFGGGGD